MKILIYGAGVLGSYLAHTLIKNRDNDVTMLARGKRVEELKQDGVVIRHYLQRKTTVDRVNVISTLQSDDVYDLIFVVMTYADFPAVLPVLADNQSRHIVLVGNNADTRAMQNNLTENSSLEKLVAFGFQLSGGLREKNGRIICIRAGGRMQIGGLDGDLSWRPLLEKAFANTNYKLAFSDTIDLWLKSHIVLILALNYVAYANGGDLRKVTGNKKVLYQVIDALNEGFKVLETLDYTITPAALAQFIRKRQYRYLIYLFLKFYTVTPITKLVDPLSLADEMRALNNAFDDWKRQANISTPHWDALETWATPNF